MNTFFQERFGDGGPPWLYQFWDILQQGGGGGGDGAVGADDAASSAAQAAAAAAAAAASAAFQNRMADKVPPASALALRRLPTIRVAPEDLIDENNRECCICFETHHLGEHVRRLPCAHIFHSPCIVDWLERHCNCPICRYELETDDAMYELGRIERMKHRKLRFAEWELHRMTVRELQQVWHSIQPTRQQQPAAASRSRDSATVTPNTSSAAFVEKLDLIQAIMSSPRVDIIHAPEPVSYYWRDLQSMSISKLKQAMHQAGVFFDPKDVVEKQDMLQIFKNSGRLVLLVEETANDAEQQQQQRDQQQQPQQERNAQNYYYNQNQNPAPDASATIDQMYGLESSDQSSFLVETVNSDDEDNMASSTQRYSRRASNRSFVFMEPVVNDTAAADTNVNSAPLPPPNQQTSEDQHHADTDNNGGMDYETISEESPIATDQHGQFDDAVEYDMEHSTLSNSLDDASPSVSPAAAEYPSLPTQDNAVNGTTTDRISFEGRSISELQLLAKFMNINVNHCLERTEIIQHLRNGPSFREAISHWSVSVLVALARLIEIDMSSLLFTNNSKEDLVLALLHEAKQRPYVAHYLNAVIPLARLSASELKDLARQRRINISDCLEVDEMIHRLATTEPS